MAADWYCLIGGTVVGPVEASELRQMAESGRLKPTDSVRKTEAGRWVPASSIKGLTFSTTAPPPRQPEPADQGIQPEIDPAAPLARRPFRDYDDPADPSDYDDEDGADDDDRRPRRRLRIDTRDVASVVLPPAICLLVTAILGVFANVFQIVISIVSPRWLQQNNIFGEGQAASPEVYTAFGALFGLLCIVIAAGAISMMRRRIYALSLTSAILSMINCGNLCCVLGLPFGIWAVVILSRPEVRAAFEDVDR
jgi:hypothetical protein